LAKMTPNDVCESIINKHHQETIKIQGK